MDINKAGKPSSRGRKAGQEVLKGERIKKVAFFVMGVTEKKDMRFFKTREEALDWLTERDIDIQDREIQTRTNADESYIPGGE